MDKFMNGIYEICTTYQPLIWILAGASMFICGIMFAIPSEKSKQMAKSSVIWIIVGVGVGLGAFYIMKEVSSKFVF